MASDCAAVYALNGRFTPDEEVRELLLSYEMPTLTDDDISLVRARFDQLTNATEADVEHANRLSEDELIARVVRSRDRRPSVPFTVDEGSTGAGQSD